MGIQTDVRPKLVVTTSLMNIEITNIKKYINKFDKKYNIFQPSIVYNKKYQLKDTLRPLKDLSSTSIIQINFSFTLISYNLLNFYEWILEKYRELEYINKYYHGFPYIEDFKAFQIIYNFLSMNLYVILFFIQCFIFYMTIFIGIY